jgi:hypothetical protein
MFTPFAFIQPLTTVTPIVPVTAAQYVLVGGQFTLYNAPTLNSIAKLNQNGDLVQDTTFNPGVGFDNTPNEIKRYKQNAVGRFKNSIGH